MKTWFRNMREGMFRRLAKALPNRLIYFTVIYATAQMSQDPRHNSREVRSLTAMEVSQYFEQRFK